MASIEVVRGCSVRGEIALGSEQFNAIARCVDVGGVASITTRVEPIYPPSQFAKAIGSLFSLWFVTMLIAMLLGDAYMHHHAEVDALSICLKAGFCIFTVLGWVMLTVIAVRSFDGRKIAPWHGAEHKVAESYSRLGVIDRDAIRRQSVISDRCGARLFALMIVAGVLSGIAIPMSCFSLWGECALFLLIVVLGIVCDGVFPRVVGVIVLSRFIQCWTTAEPGEKELDTALPRLRRSLKRTRRKMREAHNVRTPMNIGVLLIFLKR